jgi:hypothetical protein
MLFGGNAIYNFGTLCSDLQMKLTLVVYGMLFTSDHLR